jgi:Fe2+ transport system protein B
MKKKYKILIFGAPSAGKTSIINMLTGKDLKIGNTARGITFHYNEIEYNSKEDDEAIYVFSDTIGINESCLFAEESSIHNLKHFLSKAKEGYNLILHVKKVAQY